MNFNEFERFLTCPICFDFFNVCMITSCSHNYCSLCIRKYLTYKSQCPTCFEETSEPELRNNRHIDDIVKFYLNKRKNVTDNSLETEAPNDISRNAGSTVASESTEPQVPVQQPPEDDTTQKAPCPVCSLMIKVSSINVHLDMCLNRDERKDSLRRTSLSKKRKKLPKVIYHFLSDKDLKKIVSESGLDPEGDRQTLIKRHRSYLVLYNSECDSLNPKPVSEIVTLVQEEEKTEHKLARKTGEGLELDRKMDVDVIETKQKAYMKEHNSQFNQLMDDIQKRHLKGRNRATALKPVAQTSDSSDKPSTSKCENNHLQAVSALKPVSTDKPSTSKCENNHSLALAPKQVSQNTDSSGNHSQAFLQLSESDAEVETLNDSEVETLKRIHPSSTSKEESMKSVSTSDFKEEIQPAKRIRHPSDEF